MALLTTEAEWMQSANCGCVTAMISAKEKNEIVGRSLLDAACFGIAAHFQQESNWSSIFSPHFGQVHMACCALTKSITDPAPMAIDLEQRRHRRVRCIRLLN